MELLAGLVQGLVHETLACCMTSHSASLLQADYSPPFDPSLALRKASALGECGRPWLVLQESQN